MNSKLSAPRRTATETDSIAIELLAPARDKECAMAAIDHGADAVYIGAEMFGARASAGNSDQDIAEVVEYAHPFGVKVYVTLNTLLNGEEELVRARDLAWRMYRIGVDALIVQDERLASLPDFPPIPLHASTQMDNHTADKVGTLHAQGYEQIVLARELSIEEIAEIHRQVPQAILEVFIHGAICVSYNGRCYASEICYGRSANRGECAQFCRMPYDLEDEEGNLLARNRYLLSMRDMNRTQHLEALLDAGARSLKIEGRLKDAAYVKNVTAWYRQHLDAIFKLRPEYHAASQGKTDIFFQPNPERSFNRGFTNYFLHGRTPNLCNTITPKSIGERVGFVKEIRRDHIVVAGTASFANGDGLCYVDEARGCLVGFRVNRVSGNHLYPHRMPQGLTDGTVVYRNQDQHMESILAGNTARRTLPLQWTLSDTADGFRLEVRMAAHSAARDFVCEHQVARTNQEASIREVLSRLGDTIYETTQVRVNFSSQWFVPRSLLTAWRREVLQDLAPVPITRPIPDTLQDINRVPALHIVKAPLMTCRYCIRYQMGQCLRDNPQAVRGNLYLRGADGRRFLLRFHCRTCHMTVEACQ